MTRDHREAPEGAVEDMKIGSAEADMRDRHHDFSRPRFRIRKFDDFGPSFRDDAERFHRSGIIFSSMRKVLFVAMISFVAVTTSMAGRPDRDVLRVANWLVGSFDNRAQVAADQTGSIALQHDLALMTGRPVDDPVVFRDALYVYVESRRDGEQLLGFYFQGSSHCFETNVGRPERDHPLRGIHFAWANRGR